MRTRLILATALGLVVLPTAIALAAPLERELIDGYDREAHRFVFGVFDADDPCAEYDGGATTYATTTTTTAATTSTTSTATTEAGDDDAGRDWTVTDVVVAGAPEGCEFASVSVEGPNGQVNHGMFVSAFVHAIKGLGNPGCLVRLVAESDFGQGDEQVTGGDASSTTTTTTVTQAPAGSPITLVALAACDRGGKPDGTGEDGQGKPDWAGRGRPDGAGQGKPDWAGQGKPEGRGNDR